MLLGVFSIILPSYPQVCYTQKFVFYEEALAWGRLRDARCLMDHQGTLQLKTDSLSGQVVIFEAFAVWRQRRNWDGGRYKSV